VEEHPLVVRAIRRVQVGRGPYDAVAAFGSIWIAGSRGLSRFDPVRGVPTAQVAIPNDGEWTNVAASPQAVWYLESSGVLVEVEPAGDRIIRTIHVVSQPGRDVFEFVGASSEGACASQIAPRSAPGVVCVRDKDWTAPGSVDTV
jgi:ligand-binding sensor domain-containing protein